MEVLNSEFFEVHDFEGFELSTMQLDEATTEYVYNF